MLYFTAWRVSPGREGVKYEHFHPRRPETKRTDEMSETFFEFNGWYEAGSMEALHVDVGEQNSLEANYLLFLQSAVSSPNEADRRTARC